MIIQYPILPRRMLPNMPRLRPLLGLPRPIRNTKLPDPHVHQPLRLHISLDVAPALHIQPLLRRAPVHGLHPLPVCGAHLPISVVRVIQVLHLRPSAGAQQAGDGADVARPVGYAAHEQPVEDEIERRRRETPVVAGKLADVALDEGDVRGRGASGDGRQVDSVDGGVGEESPEGAGHDAGAAADVEDTRGVGERGLDDLAVHESE